MRETSNKKTWKETKFYLGWKKLIEDLKPMNWSQRFDHIWSYYKEYICLFALFAFVMTGLITSFIGAQKEVVITGIMVNISIEQEGFNYLSEDYAEYLQITKDQKVNLEYTSFMDLGSTNSEEDYYAAMTVVAEVAAKRLDYMILDRRGMAFYTGQEVYMDLRNVFTEAELADFAARDLLIYCKEEEGEPWPAAIKINDLAFIKDNVTSEGEVFFALGGSSEKYEQIRAVWEYIKAWTPKEN
jgi:hypothetical protein